MAKFATGVVDTGGKFAIGVVDTGCKCGTGAANTSIMIFANISAKFENFFIDLNINSGA